MRPTRVDGNGVVQDVAGIAVATGGFHEFSPTASAGPGSQWGVSYTSSQFTGQGTYLRTVSPK